MGLHFYEKQLKRLGTCPGYNGKRKKRMAWTDEKREEVIAAYVAANPTPENSMEIVKEIAEDHDESPNGVRAILSKAEVYVKKVTAAKAGGTGITGGTRVSKQAAHDALVGAIKDAGKDVDMDIIGKLTGKAAVYFTGVFAE